MKSIYICILTFFFYTLNSQSSFLRTYSSLSSIEPSSIIQLPDSGYIIYSTTNAGGGDNNQELRRIDKNGNVIWNKQLVIPVTSEKAGGIYLTKKNQILISGSLNNSVNLFCLDFNGNIIFQKSISGGMGFPTKIEQSNWGDITVLLNDEVIRTDSLGNLKWRKKYTINKIKSIVYLSNKKSILIGHLYNMLGMPSNEDIVHIFIDSTGKTITQKAFGTTVAWEQVYDAFQDSSSRIITIFNYQNYPENKFALGMMCSDTTGKQIWAKLLDGKFGNQISGALLKDKSIECVAVETPSLSGLFHLIHATGNGKILEDKTITSTTSFSTSNFSSFGATNDGGCFLLGNYGSTSLSSFVKLNSGISTSCLSFVQKKINERMVVFDEIDYYIPVQTISAASSNVSFNFSSLTSTIVSSCTSTCNTIASFVCSSGSSCLNSNLTFTNNSQNFSSSVWKVNNVVSGTSNNLSYLFGNAGTYTITLVASGSCIDSSKQVIYIDSFPNPNFNVSNIQLKARLMPTKIKNNTSFIWDFGDKSPLNTWHDTVLHNYTSNGNYTVCLTEKNTCGVTKICKIINLNFNYSNAFYRAYVSPTSWPNTSQYGSAVAQMSDGTFFLTGMDDSYGSTGADGLVNKLDSSGKTLNSVVIDFGNSPESIDNIFPSSDGGLIFSGSNNSGNFIAYGKVDSAGRLVYLRSFTSNVNDKPGNVVELKDGRCLFTGGYFSQGYIMGLRKNFSLQFFKRYTAFRNIRNVLKHPTCNDYFVFGTDFSNSDPVLMKLDSSMNIVWTKKFDFGSNITYATDMKISSSGKIYLTGVNFGIGLLVFAADTSGNNLWSKYYPSGMPKSIEIGKKNQLYVFGNAVLEIDTLGNLKNSWQPKIAGGKAFLTYDNGLAIAGNYSTSTTSSISIVKTDSTGFFSCASITFSVSPISTNPIISNVSGAVLTSTPTLSTGNQYQYTAIDTLFCSSIITDNNESIHNIVKSMSISPNPFSDEIHVSFYNENTDTIELYNIKGQLLEKRKVVGVVTILDMSKYSEGMYIIRSVNKDGSTSVKKAIKQQ